MFRRLLSYCVVLLFILPAATYASAPATSGSVDWWDFPYPASFDVSKLKPQSTISVSGNKFVNEQGEVVVFRGVNIADPDKLVKQKQWKKALFTELKSWGVNLIRLPVHPIAYRERGREGYFELLDQAVMWANEMDMYLALDWHSIGYLETEIFQHPMYDTDKGETFRFWKDMAQHYSGVPTFAIYEIFNEPTTWRNTFGKLNWKAWRGFNEQVIDIIWANDANVVPMVAGFNWAYDLSNVKRMPIRRKGIAYAIHPYPQKESPEPPTQENFHKVWQKNWGHLSKKYPMIASEIGWVQPNGYGAHMPVKDDGSYGPNIETFLDKRGISWTVWCFDPNWAPTMISDWDYTPTEQGKFFKDVMLRKNK